MTVESCAFLRYFPLPMFFRYSIIVSAVSLCLTGCGKPDREVRHYREINFADKGAVPVEAPAVMPMGQNAMGDLPPEMQGPALPLTWTTPDGWDAVAGSGMRIVTFTVEGQECSVLAFPGDVGGDEANIERWLGQLGVSLAHEPIHAFAENPRVIQTDGGLECRLFDFSDLIPAGSPRSVLAGIIPVEGQTVFVKLMGDAGILAQQKDAFETLCRSIGLQSDG